MRDKITIVASGIVIGISAVVLQIFGNPTNMGFCVACFVRDIAGALGLHRAAPVQYLRPEVPGLILGAFIAALIGGEFKSTGGSSPILRFVLGMIITIGALMFLGCPLRLIIRMAGGDLNALASLPGYISGICAGVIFQKNGFSLGKSQSLPLMNSYIAPFASLSLLILLLAAPFFILFSIDGPGSMRAPVILALFAGVASGAIAQRSSLCTVGAFRNLIYLKDFSLFSGLVAFFITVFAGNLIFGKINLGFSAQPFAHSDGIWNFLGMAVVGIASVLAGGCPLRQIVLSGEGDSDAFMTVLGLLFGAAFMHNFRLAATSNGVTFGGAVSVIVALLLLIVIGVGNIAVKGAKQERLFRSADA